ncbi:hypothetical protein PPERSA_02526 [Pseudocohnilembus persalinus]|uniref:Translation initiation factor beta propellor-like domain-containing protein n=1 Tax=Pseudocohnilembus persalinus TaxID=266149 RepID=A0A0V0R586_PSEPJ|nr:hypothetical protein PPERSA_02526 [Pseudocohnilembus persalinus]|eukprot:KRX09654.1 hypothetical protein PPERSA_02526 [Pseudocohnilembus persalinus]
MTDISKELDFEQFIKANPGVQKFLSESAKEIIQQLPAEDRPKKPYVEKSFEDFIIVCGLPIVDQQKFPTLQKFFCNKVLPKIGIDQMIRNDPMSSRCWGWDENKENTVGCVILDFKNAQFAEEAISGTPGDSSKPGIDGLVFDKKHTLKAFSYIQYNKIMDQADEFQAPKLLQKKELQEWQNSEEEIYAIQNGKKLYLHKLFHLSKNPSYVLPDNQPFITLNGVNKIEWSKNGTYLVEYMEEGFQLYGGKKMEKLNFYPHKNVKNIEFNSTETHILSYNGTVAENQDSENYIVWNVDQVQKVRTFKAAQDDEWGGMKFNHAGTLVGRIASHQLFVYKLPEMTLLPDPQTKERIPIVVKNIQAFDWIANSNSVCVASYPGRRDYNSEDIKKQPTKLAIIELPSRRELKWKSISWEISDVQFESEADGKYILAIMKKMNRNKLVSTLIHVVNLQNRNLLEITDLELQVGEHGALKSYNFEPNTGKLAVNLAQKQNFATNSKTTQFTINLYDIHYKGKTIVIDLIQQFTEQKIPETLWSQNGSFFALINKDKESSQQGILECGFVSKNKDKKFQAEVIRKYDNLSYMDYGEYDSTGRLIITGSSHASSINIFNALGESIYKDTYVKEDQIQFCAWRPRNKHLIKIEEKNKVLAEIKPNNANWKRWQEEDKKILNKKEYEEEQRKKKQEKEFLEYMAKKREQWDSTRKERIQLRGFDEENLQDTAEYTIILNEEIVETGIIDKK